MGNKKRFDKTGWSEADINDAFECQRLTWEPARHMQSAKIHKAHKLEMTHPHSFTVSPHSLTCTDTRRHTHISMETDKRIAGLQKEAIDKACARNWIVSKKQIYGMKKNPGGFEGCEQYQKWLSVIRSEDNDKLTSLCQKINMKNLILL